MFDAFIEEFNKEQPHEALQMKCPAEVYAPSVRPYQGIPEPHYPFHDRTVMVTRCGRLCLYRKSDPESPASRFTRILQYLLR
jgi:hypothetical protein